MPISYRDKIVDRQIGRNAELFALAVGETKKTPEERYPYLRILISIIEQARPEWHQSPNKDRQIAHAAFKLSRGLIPFDEVAEVVRLRDMERGFLPIPGLDDAEDEEGAKKDGTEATDEESGEGSSGSAAGTASGSTDETAHAAPDEKADGTARSSPAGEAAHDDVQSGDETGAGDETGGGDETRAGDDPQAGDDTPAAEESKTGKETLVDEAAKEPAPGDA